MTQESTQMTLRCVCSHMQKWEMELQKLASAIFRVMVRELLPMAPGLFHQPLKQKKIFLFGHVGS